MHIDNSLKLGPQYDINDIQKRVQTWDSSHLHRADVLRVDSDTYQNGYSVEMAIDLAFKCRLDIE